MPTSELKCLRALLDIFASQQINFRKSPKCSGTGLPPVIHGPCWLAIGAECGSVKLLFWGARDWLSGQWGRLFSARWFSREEREQRLSTLERAAVASAVQQCQHNQSQQGSRCEWNQRRNWGRCLTTQCSEYSIIGRMAPFIHLLIFLNLYLLQGNCNIHR